MKAFILAAGYGERLRPLTDTLPKSLVPALNIPSICYAIALVKEAGISEIVCNLHYQQQQIVDFFIEHDYFDLHVSFSFEDKILGTGGGLMKCREYLHDEPFVYINSDIISDCTISSVIKAFKRSRKLGILVVNENPEAGRVAVKGRNIINLRNILPVDTVSCYDFCGIAVFSPLIFKYLKPDFSDIVATGLIEFVKKRQLGYYKYNGLWHDIGTMECYREANIALLNADNSFLNRVQYYSGLAPCGVSNEAVINENAKIDRSVIGAGCSIGKDAVVKQSVLLPGVMVNDGEMVIEKIIWLNDNNTRTAV